MTARQDFPPGHCLECGYKHSPDIPHADYPLPGSRLHFTPPATLAGELLAQIRNGNRKHARDSLRELPAGQASATAFYLRDQIGDDAYLVGVVGRLLSDGLEDTDG